VELRYRTVAAAAAPVPDDMPDSARPRLLSPLAAWYVTDILRDVPPPPNAPTGAVAFKTGTSYGYRDAWAAGYDGQHLRRLAAGWHVHAGLMGLSASAPLVFDMLARISPVRAPFTPRPRSAIVAANGELPPPLRHFREPGAEPGHHGPGEPELRIVFPPDKSEIETGEDAGGERQPVILKAEGGALPLTWLVDGTPLTAGGYQRQMNWMPAGKGFAQVTVIDAKGRSERVSVRVR
jgi:penicillin-binding protein 1C